MPSVAGLLRSTCTVQTKSSGATDALGHETYSWANTYTSVPCRMGGFSGGRERFQDRDIGVIDLRLWLLPTQAIDREDRVVLDGTTYEVIEWRPSYDGAGQVHHKAVFLRRVS